MANDLVVALGARLDQFGADLDQAGNMADSAVSRIEQSFASLNPGINLSALSGIAAGGAAALGALLTALQQVNAELAAISKNAEYAGVSVERFQELKFAATQGGVGSTAATNDLREVARLLADAKVNENGLTKLLDENEIKYKDRNGDVIKLNDLLKIAADLIGKFSSMPEKVEAAKMLGLSEAWVNALRGGSKAFEDVAASAEAAGAVIDRSTIAKAEAFDTAWNKSSALLSSQFKAVTGDIAGWLDDLINKGNDWIKTLQAGGGGEGQTKFNALADAIEVARKEALGLAQDAAQLTRVIDNMTAKGGDLDIIRGLEEARKKAVELNAELAKSNLAQAMKDFPGGVPTPQGRPAGADRPSKDAASLPERKKAAEDTASAYERQYDAIEKVIAVNEAETKVAREGLETQEATKVQTNLLTAAKKDGIVVTQAYMDEIDALAGRAGKAKLALAEATLAVTKMNQASQVVGQALSTAFADAIVEGKSLNDVFKSLITTLEKAAINATVMSLFTPGAAGGLSPFASLFNFGGSGGGATLGIGHAAGGTNFAAGGMTLVGEQGPELVNLPRGAQVIPNNAMRGMSGSTGAIVYSPAIDARGASVEAVARLAQIMEADRATFASRTVATIQSARRGRVPGL
jgi:hypothetical protein